MRLNRCAGFLFAVGFLAGAAFGTDYYVATGGNDGNPGTSRELAVASFDVGVGLLKEDDDRLIVCEGEYTVGATVTLKGVQSIVGESGAAKTKITPTSAFRIFDLLTQDATVDGLTVDFNQIDYKSVDGGLAKDFGGKFLNCVVQNYKKSGGENIGIVRFTNSKKAGCTPVISNCTFRSCNTYYRSAVIVANPDSGISLQILNCSFVDCTGGDAFSRGTIWVKGNTCTIRNCLFLRCINCDSYADGSYKSFVINGSGATVIENCSLIDCAFTDSVTTGQGGPIYATRTSNTLILNSVNAAGVRKTGRNGTFTNCAADYELPGDTSLLLSDDDVTFRGPGHDDYRVAAGPTIDAGANAVWMTGAIDRRGNDRVINDTVDIGCYEYGEADEPVTYYVATTGNDENDGLSKETAKATVAAGVALLEENDRLVVCEGTYTLTETLTLRDGQSVVSEAGADKTTLAVPADLPQAGAFMLFALTTADAVLDGFTVDFKQRDYKNVVGGLSGNFCGKIMNCKIVNYYSSWGNAPIQFSTFPGKVPVVSNCLFKACKETYWSATVYAVGKCGLQLMDCAFVDCVCATYYSRGTVFIEGSSDRPALVRNCLFVRCSNNDAYAKDYQSYVINASDWAQVENCTLVDCPFLDASVGPCGPIGGGSHAAFVNCLVQDCRDANGVLKTGKGSATVSSCAADYELAGAGNLLVSGTDVVFRSPVKDDYRVASGPTIDAGTTLDWMGGAKDLGGVRDRIINGAVDIGCYEYTSDEDPRLYYVAMNGNDANDGRSKATAKATFAAGVALLQNEGDRLVLCAGDYTIANTVVLTDGQAIVGEEGAERTTLSVPANLAQADAFRLFDLTAEDAEVVGLTIDFKNRDYRYMAGGLAYNFYGAFRDCRIENFYSSWSEGSAVVKFDANVGCHPVLENCVFRNCSLNYRSATVWCMGTSLQIRNCSFIDCSTGSYFSRGTVYVQGVSSSDRALVRNCLFLRCVNKDEYADGTFKSFALNVPMRANIENCTFVDCSFKDSIGSVGGAIGGGSTDVIAYNCLVQNCTNALGEAKTGSGLVSFSHCAADYELAGGDNLLVAAGDIKFRSPRKEDYTVIRGSTINAGLHQAWMESATDIRGYDRIIGGAVDIGCFEYDPSKMPGLLLMVR